jgi:RND superfamily putative drug exporter
VLGTGQTTLVADLNLWPILAAGVALAVLAGSIIGWADLRRVRRRSGVRASFGVFERVGGFAYRRPAVVLSGWAVAMAVAALALPRLSGVLSEAGLYAEGSDSREAALALQRSFPGRPSSVAFLVFTSDSLSTSDPRYRAVVDEATVQAGELAGVDRVIPPGTYSGMVGEDGRTSYALVQLSSGDSAADTGQALSEMTQGLRTGLVRVYATGSAPLEADLMHAASQDLVRAERIGLPIAGVVLLLVFGTLVAAGMPLAVAGVALLIGFGILFLLAQVTRIGALAENSASMIGLAVGIDYSLFILTRYREEVARGSTRGEAASRAVGTAGKAVFFSGMTVALALCGLLLVPVPIVRNTVIAPIAVVLVAVAAAETLLPALLRVSGPWIDRFAIPGLRPWRPSYHRGFWVRWAGAVMRRPWWALVASVGILLAMAWPALDMRIGHAGISSAPKGLPARDGYELLATRFRPGLLGPIDVVVRSPTGALSADTAADIQEFERLTSADTAVASVRSYLSVLPDPSILETPGASTFILADPTAKTGLGNFVNVDTGADVTVVTVTPKVAPDSAAASRLVERIRDQYVPQAFGSLTVHVGGSPPEMRDAERALISSIPRVYAFVVVLSFLLLLLVFRSLLIPLKAVLMNLLSVAAAMGILVLVFEHGVGATWVGVDQMPFLDFITPVLVFAVLFGLSMDYEVFLLSRMREEYLATGDNERAVAMGLETTGRTISAAAIIMVVVFSAFVTTGLVQVKQIGLGLAVAVLVDATLVRLVLLPAAMRLLGRWNWWLPGLLSRLLPRVDIGEGAEPPTLGTTGPFVTPPPAAPRARTSTPR